MEPASSRSGGSLSDYASEIEFEDEDAEMIRYEYPTAVREDITIENTNQLNQLSPHRVKGIYDVVTLDQVDQSARALTSETADILCVDMDVAEFLLRFYKWQSSNLAQDWVESCIKVLAKAKLPSIDSTMIKQVRPKRGTFSCPVMVNDYPYSETDALGCGHHFSKDCWRRYLQGAVKDEGPEGCLGKRCVQYKCEYLIPFGFWQAYLTPPLLGKYLEFRKRSIVDTDPSLRWCPSADCGLVIRHHCSDLCDSSGMANVTCTCGEKFCFLCGDAPHSPVPCSIALKWNEKNKSEADNVTWILANTKNCPGCRQPIEKSHGCMHMTCRCRHEFCWLCLGEWKKHESSSYYRCNIYESQISEKKEEEAQRARAKEALERYAHYFERYRAHSHGERVATERQLAEVKTLIYGLHKKFPLLMDSQFLEDAVYQIIECRRFLKWSYAFGYFATWRKNPPAKILFEDHQGELEKNLDRLQEMTEQFSLEQFSSHQYQEFLEFKTKLIDLTRVIHSWFEKMSEAFVTDFINQEQ